MVLVQREQMLVRYWMRGCYRSGGSGLPTGITQSSLPELKSPDICDTSNPIEPALFESGSDRWLGRSLRVVGAVWVGLGLATASAF